MKNPTFSFSFLFSFYFLVLVFWPYKVQLIPEACISNCTQWRSQGLEVGWAQGGLGDGSPPAGSRGRAPVGVWAWGRSPQKPDIHMQSAADKRIFLAV